MLSGLSTYRTGDREALGRGPGTPPHPAGGRQREASLLLGLGHVPSARIAPAVTCGVYLCSPRWGLVWKPGGGGGGAWLTTWATAGVRTHAFIRSAPGGTEGVLGVRPCLGLWQQQRPRCQEPSPLGAFLGAPLGQEVALTRVSKNIHQTHGGRQSPLGRPQNLRDTGASGGDTVGARWGLGACLGLGTLGSGSKRGRRR